MNGLIAGRTASDMPGLDIAELRSWQNFLEAALRLSAALNGSLEDQHDLMLIEVRLLDILNTSPTGSARMGELAEALLASPSRITRLVGRLERRGLVRRADSREDARGVLAIITDEGRTAAEQAMITYSEDIRTHYLDRLSRCQMVATGDNCKRINAALQRRRTSAGGRNPLRLWSGRRMRLRREPGVSLRFAPGVSEGDAETLVAIGSPPSMMARTARTQPWRSEE